MPQQVKPWTEAMQKYLADRPGEWVSKEEVLAVGIPIVDEETALHEMGKRPSKLSPERRLSAGRRSKAQQGINGAVRFGKVAETPDGKQLMWLGEEAFSLGEVGRRVLLLEQVVDRVEALESQVQFLVDKLTGETTTTAEEFFAAAGIE